MPIEFWKTNNGGWFWTTRSPNGEIIADSAEVYSSRAKAVNGAKATAKEMAEWLDEHQRKAREKWAKLSAEPTTLQRRTTSARSKPAAKRSALSKSSQIRKTGRPKG
jgi:uncharacterized protein YegP (UPF0339 family)